MLSHVLRNPMVLIVAGAAFALSAADDSPKPAVNQPSHEEIAEERQQRIDELRKVENQPIVVALDSKGTVEFIEQPTFQAFEYLADAHRIHFEVASGTFRKHPVTLTMTGKALQDVINAVCAAGDIDWDTDGYIIYIGPNSSVNVFRQMLNSRAARRKTYPEAVARQLQMHVLGDFGAQPLSRVAQSLEWQSRVPMRIDGPEGFAKKKIVLEADCFPQPDGMPLDVTLDLLSLKYDLKWVVLANGVVSIQPRQRVPDEI